MFKTVLCGSPKGGVGKTIISINIAMRLAELGKKVAMIDADIDSANLADFMKVETPEVGISGFEEKLFEPVKAKGLELFSMGWLAKDKPVYLRGEKYAELLTDVITRCVWSPDTEYMVVDCPAGISDEFGAVVRLLGESLLGSILITQPSTLADLRRALKIHRLEEIPVIGVIENMSAFQCPNCGEIHHILGEGKTAGLCSEFGVKFLGTVPLSEKIQKSIEEGIPYVKGEEFKTLDATVEEIMSSEPKKPGFIKRLKEAGKEVARDILERSIGALLVTVNKSIPIKDIQEKAGFTKGAIIELNLTDETMTKVKWSGAFQPQPGKLVFKPNPEWIDYKIYIYDKAFFWAVLGKIKHSDGTVEPYSFYDAFLTGKVEIHPVSNRATRRAPDAFELLRLIEGIGTRVGGNLENLLMKLV